MKMPVRTGPTPTLRKSVTRPAWSSHREHRRAHRGQLSDAARPPPHDTFRTRRRRRCAHEVGARGERRAIETECRAQSLLERSGALVAQRRVGFHRAIHDLDEALRKIRAQVLEPLAVTLVLRFAQLEE